MLVMIAAAALAAIPAPRCSSTGAAVATSLAGLPPSVRASLPERLADTGQPFARYDFGPEIAHLPFARLICGYPTRDGYVVERERGGLGYSVGRVGFRRSRSGYCRLSGPSWPAQPCSGENHTGSLTPP